MSSTKIISEDGLQVPKHVGGAAQSNK